VRLAFEGLGVDLVDVFGAGGARGEPAVLRCHLQPADGGLVAGSFGEDGGDGFACQCLGGDLSGRELSQLALLFLGGCGVDALVDGFAVFGGEVAVLLAGSAADAGCHLGGEQAGDDAVLVGGPDLTVAAEEGGSGRLFSCKA